MRDVSTCISCNYEYAVGDLCIQCSQSYLADNGSEPPVVDEDATKKAEQGIEPYSSYLSSRGGFDLYKGEIDENRDAKIISNRDWEKLEYNFCRRNT